MAEYSNENSGVLFKNDKGDNPNRPDYKGSINVNGNDFWLSAWIKDGKKGKFMSLSVQPKEKRAGGDSRASGGRSDPFANAPDFDDYPVF